MASDMTPIGPAQLARRRYAKALEIAPTLADRLAAEIASSDVELRDEVAVARTLLGEILERLAATHTATSGKLDPTLTAFALQTLKQVAGIVAQAAGIEAKRGDQVLDAARVAILVGQLRGDVERSLRAAHMDAAADVVRDCFERARWTGGLTDEAVSDALKAPLAYDVKFRVIDRQADGRVVETDQLIDPARVSHDATQLEREFSEAEDSEDEPPERTGLRAR